MGWVGLGRDRSWIVPAMLARAVLQAINNQLRINTVKGNPTFNEKKALRWLETVLTQCDFCPVLLKSK